MRVEVAFQGSKVFKMGALLLTCMPDLHGKRSGTIA